MTNPIPDTEIRTTAEWLALGDLPLEAAKVLVPKKEWKHLDAGGTHCPRCGQKIRQGHYNNPGLPTDMMKNPCSVPDPLTIDWNTAKYWQGKCGIRAFERKAVHVMEAVTGKVLSTAEALQTIALMSRPEDARIVMIIAAAMAEERRKK